MNNFKLWTNAKVCKIMEIVKNHSEPESLDLPSVIINSIKQYRMKDSIYPTIFAVEVNVVLSICWLLLKNKSKQFTSLQNIIRPFKMKLYHGKECKQVFLLYNQPFFRNCMRICHTLIIQIIQIYVEKKKCDMFFKIKVKRGGMIHFSKQSHTLNLEKF